MQEMQRHGFDPWVGGHSPEEGMETQCSNLDWMIPWGSQECWTHWGSKQWPQQICFHPFILNPFAFIFDISSGFFIVSLYRIHVFLFVCLFVCLTEMTISLLKIGSRILASDFIPSRWAKIPSSIIDFVFQFFRAVLELNEKHRVFRQATQAGYSQWGHKESALPHSTE